MADHNDVEQGNSKTNNLGIILALAFYVLSVVMVAINTRGDGGILGGDVKTITLAHWQLEDGFRQGFDEAIRQYKELKAKEGIKVNIVQTTVPIRGYQQWFTTQLISGDPADIIQLIGSSQIQNQYFVPLSNYISLPNPYNKGTSLEGVPWKDTYIDGMNGALDPVYADYFGIGFYFHVQRAYVNKKLLKEATGSDVVPKTFDEWVESCRKMREYGKKVGKPIIPVGVRGLDKSTIGGLLQYYYNQLNGDLNDKTTLFGSPAVSGPELLTWMADGKVDRDRLLAAIDLVREMGRYFGEGFVTTDLEQIKFLFFTGNVGYFPEGTWDAWSIVKNSPFEVEVTTIPSLNPSTRYGNYFTGMPSELGVSTGRGFGITKASKNFDLALDFLQFLTSYKINQLTMMDYCKWPCAVRNAEYKGLMERFKPVIGDSMRPVSFPFSADKKSRTKMLETMERIIVNDIPNPKDYFWKQFIENAQFIQEETRDGLSNGERQLFDIEAQRSCAAIGLLKGGLSRQQRQNLELRMAMGLENLPDRERGRYESQHGLDALARLVEQESGAEAPSAVEVK